MLVGRPRSGKFLDCENKFSENFRGYRRRIIELDFLEDCIVICHQTNETNESSSWCDCILMWPSMEMPPPYLIVKQIITGTPLSQLVQDAKMGIHKLPWVLFLPWNGFEADVHCTPLSDHCHVVPIKQTIRFEVLLLCNLSFRDMFTVFDTEGRSSQPIKVHKKESVNIGVIYIYPCN